MFIKLLVILFIMKKNFFTTAAIYNLTLVLLLLNLPFMGQPYRLFNMLTIT